MCGSRRYINIRKFVVDKNTLVDDTIKERALLKLHHDCKSRYTTELSSSRRYMYYEKSIRINLDLFILKQREKINMKIYYFHIIY